MAYSLFLTENMISERPKLIIKTKKSKVFDVPSYYYLNKNLNTMLVSSPHMFSVE